jgi:hypothetical protein
MVATSVGRVHIIEWNIWELGSTTIWLITNGLIIYLFSLRILKYEKLDSFGMEKFFSGFSHFASSSNFDKMLVRSQQWMLRLIILQIDFYCASPSCFCLRYKPYKSLLAAHTRAYWIIQRLYIVMHLVSESIIDAKERDRVERSSEYAVVFPTR